MTRDQFKKELDERGYEWREEDEWIIVEDLGNVDLNPLVSIPDNVQFNNGGFVNLSSLKSIPDNIQFNNVGDVNLNSLESIPDNVQFNNGGYVGLQSLKSIPIDVNPYEMFPKCEDIRINGEWLNLVKNITFPNSRWKIVEGRVQMYESWVKNNY